MHAKDVRRARRQPPWVASSAAASSAAVGGQLRRQLPWVAGSAADASRGFDLMGETASVVRCTLVWIDMGRHLLLINVHHVAFDGASEAVLHRDLGAVYRALQHRLRRLEAASRRQRRLRVTLINPLRDDARLGDDFIAVDEAWHLATVVVDQPVRLGVGRVWHHVHRK